MADTLLTRSSTPHPPMTLRRGWPVLVALILATAVVTVDNTVLNVALPSIAHDLRAGESSLQWIANAYSLLFGGLLLTAGNLADRLGRRRVLLAGLTAFGLLSVLVVLVTSAPELIVLRALIGAAAAFVMPSTLALLFRVFAGPARMTAMTIWSMVSVIGFVGGPLLGGAILAHFSWQAVFLINVPIAAAALVMGWRSLPESADPSGEPADIAGSVLSVASLGSLVYTLVNGPDFGWTSGRVIASALICLAITSAFCTWELHTPHPLLPLGFLRKASFAGPAFAESTLMFAIAGLMFVVTQQLQLVDGYSPWQAGLRIAPAALGTLLTGVPGVWLARRAGQHWSAAIGFTLGGAGLFVVAQTAGGAYWSFVVGLVLFGAGLRMAMTPVALAVIDALPKERAGMGSALNDTFQEVGGALGVAILGSVLNTVYRSHLPAGVDSAAHGSLSGALLSPDPSTVQAARHAFLSGSQAAYVVGAGLMLVAAAVSLRTVPAALTDPEAVEQGA